MTVDKAYLNLVKLVEYNGLLLEKGRIMANSMTGFGRGEFTGEHYHITAEMKSVNHRYLETSVHLPRGYAFLEDKITAFLKQNLCRGKVEVYLSVESAGDEKEQLTINEEFTASYIAALRRLCKNYRLKNDISVMGVANNPNVLSVTKKTMDEEAFTADALKAMEEALGHFRDMRQKEGKRLCDDISSRCQTILDKVAFVEQRSPETVRIYRERLQEKIKELLGDRQVDEQRLVTETAVFADRIAVDEETVRLKSHIRQMTDLLALEEPVGRKLDFIVQEMNRETNTIGSKAQDLDVTNTVVDIKAEIEKIREQVQNLE